MNLYEYFEHVKYALLLLEEMQIRWIPDNSCKYKGIVSKDCKTIFIFEDEEEAKQTLLHEVIDLLINQTCLSM